MKIPHRGDFGDLNLGEVGKEVGPAVVLQRECRKRPVILAPLLDLPVSVHHQAL